MGTTPIGIKFSLPIALNRIVIMSGLDFISETSTPSLREDKFMDILRRT